MRKSKNSINLFITFTIYLASLNFYVMAATCPNINTINRISGEYLWQTTEPGWSGYFIAPVTGKGHSYIVKKFLKASWVKTYDHIKSTGFIQCDYTGDFQIINQSSASTGTRSPESNIEIIRFVQNNANSAITPNSKSNWLCQALTSYPNEACQCYGNIEKCNFTIS